MRFIHTNAAIIVDVLVVDIAVVTVSVDAVVFVVAVVAVSAVVNVAAVDAVVTVKGTYIITVLAVHVCYLIAYYQSEDEQKYSRNRE